jgi:hypothetical protein
LRTAKRRRWCGRAKNDANPAFEVVERQKDARRQREAKVARERKLEQWREERVGLGRRRRDAVHQLGQTMLAAAPALAEQAVAVLLAEVPWFKKQYEPEASALENYQRVPFLWVEVDRYLEERHAEHFRAIQQKYDERLEDIDKKIDGLTRENT